jgi:hypothetical protein
VSSIPLTPPGNIIIMGGRNCEMMEIGALYGEASDG